MSRFERHYLLEGAVRAAEYWHGNHTGGPNEELHENLTKLMRQALNETFKGYHSVTKESMPPAAVYSVELVDSFYPVES